LTWGDQQIPELVDDVADIQAITYDKKMKSMMRRTTKKRRCTLDSTLLVTTKETLLNTENAKTTDLIKAGMDIIDATLDRSKRDEKELADAKKDLDHLCHLDKYY
jgi:hypothetical protein